MSFVVRVFTLTTGATPMPPPVCVALLKPGSIALPAGSAAFETVTTMFATVASSRPQPKSGGTRRCRGPSPSSGWTSAPPLPVPDKT